MICLIIFATMAPWLPTWYEKPEVDQLLAIIHQHFFHVITWYFEKLPSLEPTRAQSQAASEENALHLHMQLHHSVDLLKEASTG